MQQLTIDTCQALVFPKPVEISGTGEKQQSIDTRTQFFSGMLPLNQEKQEK